MPIHVGTAIRRMEDEEFKARVYDLMGHVFDVHNELGRLFHEKIYQREVAFRVPDAEREVPIEVHFDDFTKTYYIDLLIDGGVIIEMKAVETLAERHKRQLMHYLFLTGLPHGKLVNVRLEQVEHAFVNNVLSLAARTTPSNGSTLRNCWSNSGQSEREDEGRENEAEKGAGSLIDDCR